ncbi:MAG: hypothetical protein A3H72_00495 [Candidatus Doudnabacteria bacterium RIFCSPLOWO2_02_FULL_48_8]|uniref:Secreted protein n=1 Tax=Candidatus Doudnabacteria bacterium RIFCSPHIGHO2_01_FULL_46_24 TaxID=1817825 RepID=A0A1F5NUH4_9BACT|nr:MAG: hypothetical protein A2720_03485 [Candidatus Doudnabacteria bacterium RIFCSPHIGHO2_01_FULL_46_24]OGE95051.1 MAG: hypothetical protein A3H72_00495 [Candidatus Doudnabacteria bacterium RIFCSPLOWO2_02_FULL_48_8]OGE95822.1 MAG: hypothetical protein A3E98_03325 [Candidatus Doudnabacteria bacterium RIFCSPHIGHO2_12_FULL_48_11]
MRNKIISACLAASLVMPVLALAQSADEAVVRCGGLAGTRCPTKGYKCTLEGDYPDALTKCVKEEARPAPIPVNKRPKAERVEYLKRSAQTQHNRTETAIDKLAVMVDRIEAYAAKLQERGVDTSSVVPSIESAKTTKEEIKAMLSELRARYEAIDPESDDVRTTVQAFMSEMKNIKKKLIEFHRMLMSIVKQLKSLERK